MTTLRPAAETRVSCITIFEVMGFAGFQIYLALRCIVEEGEFSSDSAMGVLLLLLAVVIEATGILAARGVIEGIRRGSPRPAGFMPMYMLGWMGLLGFSFLPTAVCGSTGACIITIVIMLGIDLTRRRMAPDGEGTS